MNFPDQSLAYKIATNVFKQGIECDNAAFLIRQELPALLKKIADGVKRDRGAEYMPEKEQEWLIHYGHGSGGDNGPDDPDCPCRGTKAQWACAFYGGCGFCRAAQRAKDTERDPGDHVG